METSAKKEIKRIRHLLDEIHAFAEDREMEQALPTVVERYNEILRFLEERGVLTGGLFRRLGEEGKPPNFDQIGVESRMLSGYLEEVENEKREDEEKPKKVDFGPIISLAPFLDSKDLKEFMRLHLFAQGVGSEEPGAEGSSKSLTLKALVRMAPHLPKAELSSMLETCLSGGAPIDPDLVAQLAPHVGKEELARLLRQYAPEWFGGQPVENVVATPVKPMTSPPPPGSELTPVVPSSPPWPRHDF